MLRFYNGKIIRFYPEIRITDDEVWVDGNKISYVGPKKEKPECGFEREINLGGDVLMPGFKNCHTHTAMVFLRSLADDMPLDKWLYESILPREAKLTDEALYDLTKLGILEYLAGGTTTTFDMYMKNDSYALANSECGFRTVICASLNNYDSDIYNIEREFIKFNNYNSDLISYKLGIHAEYTTSMERMEYAVSLSKKYKSPMFTHLCETKNEVAGCIERYGMTPPLLLDSIGFFDYGGGGIHCVHMSDDDISLFKEKHLYAVTNPASNLKLASGIAPIEKLRTSGIELAIGTDGAASNNSLDMFREMYLAACLQKVRESDAGAMPAEEVLKMACCNGAHLLGIDADDIAEGKLADLIVLSLNAPHMRPINNIIANIVYSGKSTDVRLTMINGKILYENGNFYVGTDIDEIYRKAQSFADTVK